MAEESSRIWSMRPRSLSSLLPPRTNRHAKLQLLAQSARLVDITPGRGSEGLHAQIQIVALNDSGRSRKSCPLLCLPGGRELHPEGHRVQEVSASHFVLHKCQCAQQLLSWHSNMLPLCLVPRRLWPATSCGGRRAAGVGCGSR